MEALQVTNYNSSYQLLRKTAAKLCTILIPLLDEDLSADGRTVRLSNSIALQPDTPPTNDPFTGRELEVLKQLKFY